MSLAMESFARNSLAQFVKLYSELAEEGVDLSCADIERKIWAKVTGGVRGNRIPWGIVKKEVKVQLPFLPEVINYERGCQALKKADGLYVPCGGKCVEETVLCQTCTKSGAKYGQLEDRGLPGTYTDPEDKHEITYGTWLAKKEKNIEEVCAAIAEAGFEFSIPASYLAVNAKRVDIKRRPGRPGVKKDVEESDDESTTSTISSKSDKAKKPKAKPKKAAQTDSEDDEPKTKAKKTEKPKAKAKKTKSEDETEKPKAKAKSKSEDESEEPKAKAKKSEEPKAKAKKSEEPKAKAKKTKSDDEKPKKAKKDESGNESDASKSSKTKKAKAEEPPSYEQLGAEGFEEELADDEIIEVDGEKFKLRNERIVFNMEGEWVGNIEDGEVIWRS